MDLKLAPPFSDPEYKSRLDLLRVRFRSSPNGLRLMAAEVSARNSEFHFYPPEVLEQYQINGIMRDLRRAAKQIVDGLPFAGPTTIAAADGSRVWRLRQLFLFPDYCINFTASMAQAAANMERARQWEQECERRFGRKPLIVGETQTAHAMSEGNL